MYNAKYCFDAVAGFITDTSSNSLGEEVSETIKAKIENGILLMSQKWQDTGTMYALTLRKID